MLRRAPSSLLHALVQARRCSAAAAAEVLVLAEHDGCGALRPSTHAALAAAAQLSAGGAATLLVAGQGAAARSAAAAGAACSGVRGVLLADAPVLEHSLAEPLAALVAELCSLRKVSHLVAPATTFGREVLPRAAGLLGVAPVTDVIALSSDGFVRPTFTGNALMTVRQAVRTPCVLTVRASSFPALPPLPPGTKPAEVHDVPAEALVAATRAAAASRSTLLRSSDAAAGQAADAPPPLSSARSVVAGGRGARDAAGFALLSELVAVLPGGALGATRAAVDAGLAPYNTQIGQTGTVVAPKLYIAAGVSGAIQHIAGMKDAGTIVAINKDPDAPIMQIADVALVADMHVAVPELIERLKTLRASGELQK